MLLTAKASCSFMFCGTIVYLNKSNNTTYDYSTISEFIETKTVLVCLIDKCFCLNWKASFQNRSDCFSVTRFRNNNCYGYKKVWYRFRCWLEREDWKFAIMLCSDKMVGSKSIYMQRRLKKAKSCDWNEILRLILYIFLIHIASITIFTKTVQNINVTLTSKTARWKKSTGAHTCMIQRYFFSYKKT